MAIGVYTLSVEDVLGIYRILVEDFATSPDPIAPAGVRDPNLLESAVYRQVTGFEGHLKYEHPLRSAASLTYGLCCDHPFYNGNKRTALVSMLVHLDRNGLTVPGVSQADLYDLMIAIADHQLAFEKDRRRRAVGAGRPSPDEEVESIYRWLRERAPRIERGEKVITYRQLRQALAGHGIEVEVVDGNRADLVRYEDRTTGFLRRRTERVRVRLGTVGYRNEGTALSKSEMKAIRQVCGLTEERGVDSRAFYSTGVVVDTFVCKYRRVLQRLAHV
jgi:death-on-curing family protein